MKFKARISFFGLLIMVFIFAGCNIFSWSASPEEGEDLLEDGLDFMFEGDFEAAESLFALGLLEDPLNSDLLYNHAKATLLSSGESIITILNELQKFDQSTGAGIGTELPFFGRPKPEQDNLYVTNITIFNDLNLIYDSTIVTTGSIERDDITLDIFIANTVKGILRIADTNGDERINNKDIDLNMFSTGGGFEFDSTFVSSFADSLDPADLNNLISSVGSIISGGSDIFGSLFGGDSSDTSSINTSAIDSLMADLTGSLEWYYVNTLADGNPGIGDNDGDGIEDDECINQIDDDGDGLIDEDAIIAGGTPGWAWFKNPDGTFSQIPCPL